MKPLLAETVDDLSILQYPVDASQKLDGIRCLVIDGVAVSRNLKAIRNSYVQSILAKPELLGFDGEILVGSPRDPMCYRNTASGVMSEDGQPDFVFYVFDMWNKPDMNYTDRRIELQNQYDKITDKKHIKLLPDLHCKNVQDLIDFEKKCSDEGYEGVMVRDPKGRYKHGRSTLKEGILLKVKRFIQDEFVIEGFTERMKNNNEKKTNALGRSERSTHKENKAGRGDLGALVCSKNGQSFTIGTGFTDAERQEIWDNQEKYLGAIVTCKFFEYGEYVVPRFPVFVGFRDAADMGE